MSSLPPGLVESQRICHELTFNPCQRSVRVKLQENVYEDIDSDVIYDPRAFFIPIPEPFLVVKNQRFPLQYYHTFDTPLFGIEFTSQLLEALWYFNLETFWVLFIGGQLPGERPNAFFDLNLIYIGYSILEPMRYNKSSGRHCIGNFNNWNQQFECKYIGPWRSPPRPKPNRSAETRTQPGPPPDTKPKPSKPARRSKDRTHKPVLNRFPCLKPGSNKRRFVNRVYNEARTKDIKKDRYYQGKKSHTGLLYSYGNARLAIYLDLHIRTIVRFFKWFCENDIFQQRHDGGISKGNNIYELVRSDAHFKLLKRNRKMRGKHTRKLKPGRK